MFDAVVLNAVLFLPLLGVGLLLLVPADQHALVRRTTLAVMVVQFLLTAWL